MTRQIQDAYIVAAVRTPVGKAPRGMFRNVRPDDMLAHVLKGVMAQVPGLDPARRRRRDRRLRDARSRAGHERGAHRRAARGPARHACPAMTINRFCSSGVQAVALAADRIRTGDDDVVIAAGTESMSMVPMMGNKIALNDAVFANDENVAIAYGMGITAENVAKQWKVTREEQDAFARGEPPEGGEGDRRAAASRTRSCPTRSRPPRPTSRAGEVVRAQEGRRHRRGAAPRFDARGPGEAEDRVRRARQRDRRQQLADVRRRGRRGADERAGDEEVRREADGALRGLRGRRRAAGDHGHRPDQGDPEGAFAVRNRAGRPRLDRAERGLRRPGARRDQATWASIPPR